MSNFKKMVHRTFDEVAEEENLYSEGQSFSIRSWITPIGRVEKESLEAMIFYRAEGTACSEEQVRAAVECHFVLDDISSLPRSQFEAAMDYLMKFSGLN